MTSPAFQRGVRVARESIKKARAERSREGARQQLEAELRAAKLAASRTVSPIREQWLGVQEEICSCLMNWGP